MVCHSHQLQPKALQETPLKPPTLLRYVDDNFLIWPHGRKALDEFHDFMDKFHPSTMELEGLDLGA